MGASLSEAASPLLRIGAFPHTTTTVLPQIVQALVSGPTSWRLQILSNSAERLLQQLIAGDIDLLLGQLTRQAASTPAINGLAQRVLYQGKLSVVTRRDHPLSGRRQLPMSDLLAWPWVLPDMQSTTRVALVDAFLRQGLAPPMPVVESPSFFFSLPLVASTDLLTCCAHSAALVSHHQTSILPVAIGLDPTPVALVWRKNSAEALRAVAQLKGLRIAMPGTSTPIEF